MDKTTSFLRKFDSIPQGKLWLTLFSGSLLIQLWVSFFTTYEIPSAFVGTYTALLGSYVVKASVDVFKGGNKDV